MTVREDAVMQCSEQEWLSLVRARGVGNRTLLPLIRQSANLDALLCNASGPIADNISRAVRQPDSRHQQQDMIWLENSKNHLLPITDPRYPQLLLQTDDPPVALFIHGDPDLLSLPQLAIVGSRNPSKSGLDNAFAFARHLAGSGMTITSGMALGIDAQAHLGCLAADGTTLAVIGTGTDRVYPASHHKLAHQIAEKGAIISEFPPGTEPRAGNFPRRNRIISALSLGTLVVEATLKSGSLITAGHALEQGREVFAIPGSIHSPQSKGCHRLIKQGAKLVEQAQDIIEEFAPLISTLDIQDNPTSDSPSSVQTGLDEDYLQLLEKMGWDPVSMEQIMHATSLPAESVSSMLLLLELQGHVSSAPGGYYSRTIPSN